MPALLFNALSSNRTLKYIDLSFIEGITTNQWMSLATSLNNMPLEKLRLHGNQENDGGEEIEASTINGEVVASFATLLSNSSSLNTLDFGGNHDVGDGVVSTFAAALTKNRTLSILALDQVYTIEEDDYSDIITNMGWDAILRLHYATVQVLMQHSTRIMFSKKCGESGNVGNKIDFPKICLTSCS